MLLEVHDRFKDRIAVQTLAAAEDSRSRDATPREVLEAAVTSVIALYRANHRLLRSVLLAGNAVMYERTSERQSPGVATPRCVPLLFDV